MDIQEEGGYFHGWKDRSCELHFAFGIPSINKDRYNARITYLPMNWKYLWLSLMNFIILWVLRAGDKQLL